MFKQINDFLSHQNEKKTKTKNGIKFTKKF